MDLTYEKNISTAASIKVQALKEGVKQKFGKTSINHVLFCAVMRSLEVYYKMKVLKKKFIFNI